MKTINVPDVSNVTKAVAWVNKKFGGIAILIIIVFVIADILGWTVYGRSAESWSGFGLSWLIAMLAVWCTLQVLARGFGGSTSLDEFLELMATIMAILRKEGGTIDLATALFFVGLALRSGLLLIFVAMLINAVLGYQHPQGG